MKIELRSGTPINKKHRTKPKVVREWVEDDVFKLISLIEDQKCLWDADNVHYTNKILRDRAWTDIAEKFSLKYSTADLNAKWTNLRIQFRSYNGRAKRMSSQGSKKTPKWKFYNAMSFLGRPEHGQSQQNISNTAVDVDSDCDSSDHDMVSTPTLWEDPIKLRQQQNGNYESTSTPIVETMREVVTALKEGWQNTFEPNTTFSNYLLSELKTLSDESAASVRKKVIVFFLQCLEEERLKKINNLDMP